MIKILWNQCECETEVDVSGGLQYAQASAAQGYYKAPKVIEQCGARGQERIFADGHMEIMCDTHWGKCVGIVDKSGAKHMKP